MAAGANICPVPWRAKLPRGRDRKAAAALRQPFRPIARSLFAVHHCHDPHPVRQIKIDYGIGKAVPKMSPRRRVKHPEQRWLTTDIAEQFIHLIMEL